MRILRVVGRRTNEPGLGWKELKWCFCAQAETCRTRETNGRIGWFTISRETRLPGEVRNGLGGPPWAAQLPLVMLSPFGVKRRYDAARYAIPLAARHAAGRLIIGLVEDVLEIDRERPFA